MDKCGGIFLSVPEDKFNSISRTDGRTAYKAVLMCGSGGGGAVKLPTLLVMNLGTGERGR